MNLTSREKKLFIVLALVLCGWWMLGCGSNEKRAATSILVPEVTTAYLKNLYAIDNERYFQNSLPKDPDIDMTEKLYMASTVCEDGSCVLKFNPRYTSAFRIADFTMLHEQCHIKTWGMEIDPITKKEVVHGKVWRSCMLQLDAAGAFREIIIDNYSEGM